MATNVRNKIEFINNLSQEFSPFIGTDSIKVLKQELKENYIIPDGYNGVSINLKVPDGIELVVPTNSTLVIL
jgi:hypothetical protein